ncbi:DUF6517 family protein [Natrinema zhouii]|uniref:Uncharacterized protein n=1 Tax=Natrinema zhouii TaxID=1710539 RepID=A0A7D6GVZ5_9EURY|nr:DUF6517 family protein [Natrinema zhouii]QLK26046.1 DUF6517 family protein [Natrinema zhouii]
MNRRLFLGALAAGGVGTVAGCLSSSADEMAMVSAAPARVSKSAATEAGYEYQGTIKRVETQQVGGEGVELTSYNSIYDRAIDRPAEQGDDRSVGAGVFSVLAAPHVTAGGEEFNPVGAPSNVDLAERVQRRYDGVSLERAVGGRSLEALGERFPVESYEGMATLDGEFEIDVALDIIRNEHEGDHLVVVAIHPVGESRQGGTERGRIDTLVRGLEQYDDLEVDIVETEGEDG